MSAQVVPPEVPGTCEQAISPSPPPSREHGKAAACCDLEPVRQQLDGGEVDDVLVGGLWGGREGGGCSTSSSSSGPSPPRTSLRAGLMPAVLHPNRWRIHQSMRRTQAARDSTCCTRSVSGSTARRPRTAARSADGSDRTSGASGPPERPRTARAGERATKTESWSASSGRTQSATAPLIDGRGGGGERQASIDCSHLLSCVTSHPSLLPPAKATAVPWLKPT